MFCTLTLKATVLYSGCPWWALTKFVQNIEVVFATLESNTVTGFIVRPLTWCLYNIMASCISCPNLVDNNTTVYLIQFYASNSIIGAAMIIIVINCYRNSLLKVNNNIYRIKNIAVHSNVLPVRASTVYPPNFHQKIWWNSPPGSGIWKTTPRRVLSLDHPSPCSPKRNGPNQAES